MIITPDIFPDLQNTRWAEADLDELIGRPNSEGAENPCLNALQMNQFVANLHRQLGVNYTLGGYAEDRRVLWRNSYLDPQQAVHCGIDLNVPAGTRVALAHESIIERVMDDPDQNGGWGRCIVLRLQNGIGPIYAYIVAHLAQGAGLEDLMGKVLPVGTAIGYAGVSIENGGWYDHVHVQAMTEAEFKKHGGDIHSGLFDGYDAASGIELAAKFPNPMPLLYKLPTARI